MQSSATVAFRAAVMLICLIAIPLAALFGTRLPDLVGQFLDRRSEKTRTGPRELLAEAPAFEGTASPDTWVGHPDSAVQEGQTRRLPPDLTDQWGLPDRVASTGNAAAQPVGGPFGSFPAAGHSAGESGSPAPPAGHSQPIQASYEFPIEPMPNPNTGGRPAESPPRPFEPTDRFADIQKRLRDLGATYYALETWGDRGEYYHFQAKMALGTGENQVRHFDATDADPLAAMARVLMEVERWRAGE